MLSGPGTDRQYGTDQTVVSAVCRVSDLLRQREVVGRVDVEERPERGIVWAQVGVVDPQRTDVVQEGDHAAAAPIEGASDGRTAGLDAVDRMHPLLVAVNLRDDGIIVGRQLHEMLDEWAAHERHVAGD